MEIEESLSVSYGPLISGSGAGSYLKDKVKSKRQISVLYRTLRAAYTKGVNVRTLKPVDGLDTLSTDEIAEMYGSKFIGKYCMELNLMSYIQGDRRY